MIYSLDNGTPQCGKNVYIANTATVVGDVVLGDYVGVWFGAVIRGDNERITLGNGTNVQDCSVLHTDPGMPAHYWCKCNNRPQGNATWLYRGRRRFDWHQCGHSEQCLHWVELHHRSKCTDYRRQGNSGLQFGSRLSGTSNSKAQ